MPISSFVTGCPEYVYFGSIIAVLPTTDKRRDCFCPCPESPRHVSSVGGNFGATPVIKQIGIVNLYYGVIDLFILRAVNEFYLSWPKVDVRKENRLVVCSDEELNFDSGVFRVFRIVIICADFMPGSETVVWNKHILFCGIRVYDTVFPRCNQERDLTGLLSTLGNRGCDRICRDRRAKYQLVHMHVGIFGWVERKRQFPQMVPQSVLIELLGKNSLY